MSPYEILGVRENATPDEIRNAYNLLVKKFIAKKESDPSNAEAYDEQFKVIEKAYCELMGLPYYETMTDDTPGETIKIFNKSIDSKKVKNFFDYNKWKIVLGIIAAVFLAVIIKQCATRVEPDVTISFIGRFVLSQNDVNRISEDLKNSVEGINEVFIQTDYLTDDLESSTDIPIRERVFVMLATGGYDIIIMDRPQFDLYVPQGAFLNLDPYYELYKLDKAKNEKNKLLAKGAEEEHYYGIDLSELPFFDKYEIRGDEKILCIHASGEKKDNALKILDFLLESRAALQNQ